MRDLIADIIAEFVSIPHIHAARSAEFKPSEAILGNMNLRRSGPKRTISSVTKKNVRMYFQNL